MTDNFSQWYPYIKVHENYFNFKQYAEFPKLICDYLIDAPQDDYIPPDNNDYSRCRLWKYLYYDNENPLSYPLPTISQKMSVLFNPKRPTEPPSQKGYRLIPQEYIQQAQTNAQTRIYIYMGRTVASQNDTVFSSCLVFDIFTHYTYELNTKTNIYSRTGGIVAALIEALNGINITGIGTFSMSKRVHPDSGTVPIYDGDTNVGTKLTIGLEMTSFQPILQSDFNNMPKSKSNSNIRLA